MRPSKALPVFEVVAGGLMGDGGAIGFEASEGDCGLWGIGRAGAVGFSPVSTAGRAGCLSGALADVGAVCCASGGCCGAAGVTPEL